MRLHKHNGNESISIHLSIDRSDFSLLLRFSLFLLSILPICLFFPYFVRRTFFFSNEPWRLASCQWFPCRSSLSLSVPRGLIICSFHLTFGSCFPCFCALSDRVLLRLFALWIVASNWLRPASLGCSRSTSRRTEHGRSLSQSSFWFEWFWFWN